MDLRTAPLPVEVYRRVENVLFENYNQTKDKRNQISTTHGGCDVGIIFSFVNQANVAWYYKLPQTSHVH